ncbi:DUF882 domain-containing protein [Neorhizobium lilium]|uniref:Murein endopeptidase K n=1 Tax=Neorhizobium lilium TaxID=2503024 RepID=A0A3S3RK71_9HYPH|nr:DUF882 domain-containing protein [Neorhizobium lilium]RWX78316.1 DUF882 domain-containing protein [Neorhizobium lilium]
MFQSLSLLSPPISGSFVSGLLARLIGGFARALRTAAVTFAALVGSVAGAEAEDRALKLFFTHTGERAEITYKRDGRLDPKGLAQMNHFLRDWRRNETARIDPRLLDLVWEIYDRSGAEGPIHIVSGYRSPSTNSMLKGRSRVSGVATKSQHMLGRAVDFYIPGIKLSTLRALAIQLQGGGVGYYPTFVHVDVGNVRAWPRMSRQELARLFPDGRTVHMPADGRPLSGYTQAVAQYKRRGAAAKSVEIASAPIEEGEDELPSRRSVATAMLPTPRSRAEMALAAQVRAPAASASAPAPGFTDLASLAVPTPALRPSPPIGRPVETAALDVTRPAPAAGIAPDGPPARAFAAAPTLVQGFGREIGGGSGQTTASIASLPIGSADMEPEDAFDGQEALLAWAVSPPGSTLEMTAPYVVERALADHTAQTTPAPLPLAASDRFDGGRFWSDG